MVHNKNILIQKQQNNKTNKNRVFQKQTKKQLKNHNDDKKFNEDQEKFNHSSSSQEVIAAIKTMKFRQKRGTRMKDLMNGNFKYDNFWDQNGKYFGGSLSFPQQQDSDDMEYQQSSSGRDEFDSDFDQTDSYPGKRGRKKNTKTKRKTNKNQSISKKPTNNYIDLKNNKKPSNRIAKFKKQLSIINSYTQEILTDRKVKLKNNKISYLTNKFNQKQKQKQQIQSKQSGLSNQQKSKKQKLIQKKKRKMQLLQENIQSKNYQKYENKKKINENKKVKVDKDLSKFKIKPIMKKTKC